MRILILNLIPNTLGDCLFLTPLFAVLKNKFSKSQLHVTVSPENRDLFEANNDINKLIVLNDLSEIGKNKGFVLKGLAYVKMFKELIKLIIKKKYDLCIVTQPNFFLSHLIPFFGGVKKRIGYSYSSSVFSFVLTHKILFENPLKSKNKRHYIDSVLDLVSPIVSKIDEKNKFVKLNVDKIAEKGVKKILAKRKIKRFVCFQPGAKWLRKQWPPDKFRQLGELIKKKYHVIILGSKKEKGLGNLIKKNNKRVINLCGILSLKEVAAIMKYAKLNICNDSGLAHISSAVGTTTAVIYGATAPRHSEPRGKGRVIKIYQGKIPSKIIRHNEEFIGINLMKSITVETVYKKISKEL